MVWCHRGNRGFSDWLASRRDRTGPTGPLDEGRIRCQSTRHRAESGDADDCGTARHFGGNSMMGPTKLSTIRAELRKACNMSDAELQEWFDRQFGSRSQ